MSSAHPKGVRGFSVQHSTSPPNMPLGSCGEIQDFGSFRYNGKLIPRCRDDGVIRDRQDLPVSRLRERSMQFENTNWKRPDRRPFNADTWRHRIAAVMSQR